MDSSSIAVADGNCGALSLWTRGFGFRELWSQLTVRMGGGESGGDPQMAEALATR